MLVFCIVICTLDYNIKHRDHQYNLANTVSIMQIHIATQMKYKSIVTTGTSDSITHSD